MLDLGALHYAEPVDSYCARPDGSIHLHDPRSNHSTYERRRICRHQAEVAHQDFCVWRRFIHDATGSRYVYIHQFHRDFGIGS